MRGYVCKDYQAQKEDAVSRPNHRTSFHSERSMLYLVRVLHPQTPKGQTLALSAQPRRDEEKTKQRICITDSHESALWKYRAPGISSPGKGGTLVQTKVSRSKTYRSETIRRSATRRPPKRYILSPTIVVEAPTSLGGTVPDVLRDEVVRSETECMMVNVLAGY